MTDDEAAGEFHNRLAPEIMNLMLAPIDKGHGIDATLVLLQSVICATMFAVSSVAKNPTLECQRAILAAVFDGVVNRITEFHQRKQANGE